MGMVGTIGANSVAGASAAIDNNMNPLSSTSPDSFEKRQGEIYDFFRTYPSSMSAAAASGIAGAGLGVPLDKFVHATKRLCGLPSFFNAPLVHRINVLFDALPANHAARTITVPATPPQVYTHAKQAPHNAIAGQQVATTYTHVSLPAFAYYWKTEIADCSRTIRFFRLIKQPNVEYITKDDFVPFMQELLHFHPGLDFLDGMCTCFCVCARVCDMCNSYF